MKPDPRRRRHILTAGAVAGVACVILTWSFTLWPGAALICGAVMGPLVAFLYSFAYDAFARR